MNISEIKFICFESREFRSNSNSYFTWRAKLVLENGETKNVYCDHAHYGYSSQLFFALEDMEKRGIISGFDAKQGRQPWQIWGANFRFEVNSQTTKKIALELVDNQ